MNKPELSVSVITGLLALLGVVFSARFLLVGGNNAGFLEYPVVTFAHVAPGLLYLTLAPLQFLRISRSKNPSYHRWSGRLLTLLGLLLGAAALFIGLVFPYSGVPEQMVISIFGTLFLVSIVQGFLCARRKDFSKHREWMLRAFAIGLSIVTMRLIFIPMLIIFGASQENAVNFSIIAFTIAFALHWGFAEYWIRRTRVAVK